MRAGGCGGVVTIRCCVRTYCSCILWIWLHFLACCDSSQAMQADTANAIIMHAVCAAPQGFLRFLHTIASTISGALDPHLTSAISNCACLFALSSLTVRQLARHHCRDTSKKAVVLLTASDAANTVACCHTGRQNCPDQWMSPELHQGQCSNGVAQPFNTSGRPHRAALVSASCTS